MYSGMDWSQTDYGTIFADSKLQEMPVSGNPVGNI